MNFSNYGSRNKIKIGLSFLNILRIFKFSGNNKKKNILYFTVKSIFSKNSKFFHFPHFVNIITNFNFRIDELYEMKKNLIFFLVLKKRFALFEIFRGFEE